MAEQLDAYAYRSLLEIPLMLRHERAHRYGTGAKSVAPLDVRIEVAHGKGVEVDALLLNVRGAAPGADLSSHGI